MKKSIKTIGAIVIMGIMMILSYLLGTIRAEPITEIQTVTEVVETEKTIEVVPDGYIDSLSAEFQENYVDMRNVIDFDVTECGLQLYFVDGTGYWWEGWEKNT